MPSLDPLGLRPDPLGLRKKPLPKIAEESVEQTGFLKNLWDVVNPVPFVRSFSTPFQTVKGMGEAQDIERIRALQALKAGDYMGAARHSLGYAVPIFGPLLSEAGEQLERGDISGAAGKTLGAAALIAGPKAISAGRGVLAELATGSKVVSATESPTIQAMLEAKKVRGQQEKVFTAERGQRAAKEPWEMTREELDIVTEQQRLREGNTEKNILGNDYAAWNKAQRQLGSMDNNVANAAEQTIKTIESKLSKADQDRLYGIGERGYSTEDLQAMKQAVDALDDSSPEALGKSLRFAVTKISPKSDLANLTLREKEGLTQIRHAIRIVQEKGWDENAVVKSAIGEAAKRFSDPQDAILVLGDYAKAPKVLAEYPDLQPRPEVPSGAASGVPPVKAAEPPIVQTMREAIRSAKKIRGQQEKVFTAERGQRAAKGEAIGQNLQGEEWYKSQLGSLKGEMTRVQFESIRSKFRQPQINELYSMVKNSDLRFFDKITAARGLTKMFEGAVPQPSELTLLRRVYGKGLIDDLLAQRTTWAKIKDAGYQLLNTPRALMSAIDFSAPFRQGLLFATKPKQFFPAFREMFKSFGSENGYRAVIDEIERRPTYDLMKESGLQIVEAEEKFQAPLAEKVIPGVRRSARAYNGFLNKLRADVFDDLLVKAGKQGINTQDLSFSKSLANWVNIGTGRGPVETLAGAADVLNATFYSPRLMSSRLQLFDPRFWLESDPFVRKQAIYSYLSTAASGMTLLQLAKMAGAEVGADPRSSDFGKIIIRNESGRDTRIDIWGGYQQYFRMVGQLYTKEYVSSVTGKKVTLGEGYKGLSRYDILMRQIESKESPIASLITTMLKQVGPDGKPVSLSKELLERITPMAASEIYQTIKENPELWPTAGASIFGVGMQTYGESFQERYAKEVAKRLNKKSELMRRFNKK